MFLIYQDVFSFLPLPTYYLSVHFSSYIWKHACKINYFSEVTLITIVTTLLPSNVYYRGPLSDISGNVVLFSYPRAFKDLFPLNSSVLSRLNTKKSKGFR